MRIAGLQRCSTIDFPGRLSAVLFAAGCNFCCAYCHNRSILHRPPLLAEEDVLSFLQKRAGLLEGAVFSGGEPTLQSDLAEWLRRVRGMGYQTKLDTNGSRPAVLRRLLDEGLLNYAAMDYKAPPAKHFALCGAEAEGFGESLRLLMRHGVAFELRTTLAPQLDLADLRAMAAALPPGIPWALQLCRPVPGCSEGLYAPARVQSMAAELAAAYPGVFARC